MDNFVQQGDVLTLTAPSGGVTSGAPVKIGSLVVVPLHDADVGEKFEGKRTGVFNVAKLTTDDFTEGALIYWDDANSRTTLTATANTFVGYGAEDTASGAAKADVLFCGTSGL